MPKLFIVGAQKSGTTTMVDVLTQHPDCFVFPGKEPNFFGSDLTRHVTGITAQEYKNLSYRTTESQVFIDGSTTYLISKSAAKEIKEHDPDSKILILLV